MVALVCTCLSLPCCAYHLNPVRCRSTGSSSQRYGACEVCKEPASDVWIGTADGGRIHVFGHELCVRKAIGL